VYGPPVGVGAVEVVVVETVLVPIDAFAEELVGEIGAEPLIWYILSLLEPTRTSALEHMTRQ
jgi:hypothetical protein